MFFIHEWEERSEDEREERCKGKSKRVRRKEELSKAGLRGRKEGGRNKEKDGNKEKEKQMAFETFLLEYVQTFTPNNQMK